MRIQEVTRFLDAYAPCELAETWDNVGLLVGDPEGNVERVMTCLTLTPPAVEEAIERRAQLVVTHHPLPFRPIKRITTESYVGRLLWRLIGQHVAVYSPHTAFDSASAGINQWLAESLGLINIRPLRAIPNVPEAIGSGRLGELSPPLPAEEFLKRVADRFSLRSLRYVASGRTEIHRVGIGCGSGGTFLEDARHHACDYFVTGEATFHDLLEAEARGPGVVLLGHYTSERFALERLADVLRAHCPGLEVWACRSECDPIRVWPLLHRDPR